MNAALQSPLTALLLLAALSLWWLSAVKAREQARALAASFCQRHGWQLLDQTVALISMRPARINDRIGLRRRYRFEFSPDGGNRRAGELCMENGRAVRITADMPEGGTLVE